MTTLEIENIQIDLLNEPISLNKQAYAIENWAKQPLNFSDVVKLPETNIVRQIFQRPGAPEIVADKYNKYYKFKYKDFSTILFSGNALLISSNQEVEIQLLDESMVFFDNLNKKLNKLDFESSDFVFSSVEYDLKKISNSSVWIWPAVAMHENRNVNNTILAGGAVDAKLKFSRPMFNSIRLFEQIALTNKWRFDYPVEIAAAEMLALSANHSKFYVTSYQKTLTQTINGSGSVTGLDINDFIYNVVAASTSLNINNISTKFRLRGSITATEDSTLIINGLSTPSGTDAQKQEFLISKGTFDYDITSNLFKTTENNNNIDFSIVSTGNVTFNNALLYSIIEEQDLGALSGNNLVGYRVKAFDNMPDLTQLALIKELFTMFGAYFNTENFKNTIKVDSYLRLNKNNSLDWSDKFIEDTEMISGKLGNFGQTNYYQYDNDDTIPEQTGRGQFLVNNGTLIDINTTYKSNFSASNDVEIDSLDMADFNIYDNDERINDLNPRILFYQLDTGRGITYATFRQLSGDNLLNNYHKNITDSLYNITVLEADFNLNRTDFFTFDFTKTVYIKKFKSTFLVLSINEYIEGKPSKVRLLKYK